MPSSSETPKKPGLKDVLVSLRGMAGQLREKAAKERGKAELVKKLAGQESNG